MLQHSPILPDSSASLRFCRESFARYLGLSVFIYGSILPGIPVTHCKVGGRGDGENICHPQVARSLGRSPTNSKNMLP
jgi:hypothetical protein